MVVSNTRVIQVTNIAPQATKDQMQTLFGYLGKIDDIRLYPTIRDVSCPVQSRICYVKYYEGSTVGVAQHMTNTVFIDRALIVIPVQSGEIPDEHKALEMSSNGTLVPGLNPAEPRLPPDVVNTLEGVPPNQVIQTHDARMTVNGLPNYPPLPAAYDSRKIEEIRRTVLVIDLASSITSQQLIDHFGSAGLVKYLRFCERDSDKLRYALVEFSEQDSIQSALKLNGSELDGNIMKVHHATQAISKPQTKSNEAAQREIEEAMCRVKEAQNLISAAIDPVIGMLSKDKRRSRSRSRSRRRSRSRQRSRRSRSRSRHRRRSRSRSRRRRHRSRSRSSRRRSHSRKRSRSHGKGSKSKRDRSRNRDREKDRDRDKDRDKPKREEKDKVPSPEKESSLEKKRSLSKELSKEPSKEKRLSRSREKKSRERKRSKSRDRDKKRSKSKEKRVKRSRSRDKRRSKSRDRKRSRSRERKKSKSRERKRSRSREKKKSRSRERKKSRSRDRKRSHSKSKSKRRSKSPSEDSRTDRKRDGRDKESIPKVARDYDEEERGFEADNGSSRKSEARSVTPDTRDKDSPDNMDISNSP